MSCLTLFFSEGSQETNEITLSALVRHRNPWSTIYLEALWLIAFLRSGFVSICDKAIRRLFLFPGSNKHPVDLSWIISRMFGWSGATTHFLIAIYSKNIIRHTYS